MFKTKVSIRKRKKIATVFLLRRDLVKDLTVGNSHRSKKECRFNFHHMGWFKNNSFMYDRIQKTVE